MVIFIVSDWVGGCFTIEDRKMKQRVLFLSLSFGTGHNHAAEAIKKALTTVNLEVESFIVDSLSYTNPITEKIYRNTYHKMIKTTPELWGRIYNSERLVERTNKIRNLMNRINSRGLRSLLKEFNPEVIVCTQWLPCGVVCSLKARGWLDNIPIVNVITDFGVHSFHIYKEVSAYVVASESVREKLVKKGTEPDKIHPFGIPIDPVFGEKLNRGKMEEKLGLKGDMLTVLISGGGLGLGPITGVIRHLNKFKNLLQVIVVTGKNKTLKRRLERLSPRLDFPLKVYGYVDNIYELMEVADLVISKPGGLSTSEAFAKNLPIIIVNPIPGQETENSDFITNGGAGIKVDRVEEINENVEELLNNPAKLEKMKMEVAKLAKPKAALDTAKMLSNFIEK